MNKNKMILLGILMSITALGFSTIRSVNGQKRAHESKNLTCNPALVQKPIVLLEKKYSDFFYDFGSRFEPISKDQLHHASNIEDLIPEITEVPIYSIESVAIIEIREDRQTDHRELGSSLGFTESQLQLLKSADYNFHFTVRVEYLEKNSETRKIEHDFKGPHFTVVPEKQASYEYGKEELLEFFRENNHENTADIILENGNILASKLYFTITKEGVVSKVYLDRSTGIPAMDETMIQLISQAPGKWSPAENEQGERIEQELVISFGVAGVGC